MSTDRADLDLRHVRRLDYAAADRWWARMFKRDPTRAVDAVLRLLHEAVDERTGELPPELRAMLAEALIEIDERVDLAAQFRLHLQ